MFFKRLTLPKKIAAVMAMTLLGLSLVFPVAPVLAASAADLEITTMDLQIWPEYDDPRVLAIYSGTLRNTSGQSYSGNISFNIPKDIEVKMACEIVNGSEHSCQPYDIEDKGEYQVLSWRTTKPIQPGEDYPFWLEYYYSPLKGSPDKTMQLIHTPYYKTQNMKLTVKQPLDSTNFTTTPEASSKGQDGQGFTDHFFTYNNIDSASPVKVDIAYTRSKTKPSVEPSNPNGSENPGSDPLGTSAWKKPEVIIPVALFTIALAGFIIYSLYYSKSQPPIKRVKRINNKYGNGKNAQAKTDKGSQKSSGNKEKKRIRQMLLDGKITEETYRELMDELEAE